METLENNIKKIKKNSYKIRILKAIGITGQLQKNRSRYYFKHKQMFSRALSELKSEGIVVDSENLGGSKNSKYEIPYPKDLKNVMLTKLGKDMLKELYPELYEFYISKTPYNNKVSLNVKDREKSILFSMHNRLLKYIEKIDNETIRRNYLDDFYDTEFEDKKDFFKFIEDRPSLGEIMDGPIYKGDEKLKTLYRTLKTMDIVGFCYNNYLGVLPSEKVSIKGRPRIKNSLYNIKGYFYDKSDLKGEAGGKIDFSKVKGAIFSENVTLALYNNPQDKGWLGSHEKKVKNTLESVRKRIFCDYKEGDISALIFGRSYDAVKLYVLNTVNEISNRRLNRNAISDKDGAMAIIQLEDTFSDIYFIPLFVDEKYDTYLGDAPDNIAYEYSDEMLRIILENTDENISSYAKSSFEKNKEYILEEDKHKICLFMLRNKITYDRIYYLSFFSSNIRKLKSFINFYIYKNNRADDKFIILAFDFQKNFLNMILDQLNDDRVVVKYTKYTQFENNPLTQKIYSTDEFEE